MAEVKTYTLKEIKEHSKSDSIWLLIDNSIYDVTKFLDEHPGGPEILLDWGGKEATEAFEDAGHSTDARTLMKDYKIGELCENDRKKPGTSTCFCLGILIPVGVALSAVLLYQIYARLSK